MFGTGHWEWRPRDREGQGRGGVTVHAGSPPPQQDCMDLYAVLVIGAAGAAREHGPHRLYQVRGLGGPEDGA